MKRLFIFIVLISIFSLFFASSIFAVDDLIKIYGKVTNRSGQPLPDIRISVYIETGTNRYLGYLRTDICGRFGGFLLVPREQLLSRNYLVLRATVQLHGNWVTYEVNTWRRLDPVYKIYEINPVANLKYSSSVYGNEIPVIITGKLWTKLDGEGNMGIHNARIKMSVFNYSGFYKETITGTGGEFSILGCVPDTYSIVKIEAKIFDYTKTKYLYFGGRSNEGYYNPVVNIELKDVNPIDFLEPSSNPDSDGDGLIDGVDTVPSGGDLISYWDFNNASNIGMDKSGRNNLTISGSVTSISGRHGRGVQLGESSYLYTNVPTGELRNSAWQRSIAAWVKTDKPNATIAGIWSNYSGGYLLSIAGGGSIEFFYDWESRIEGGYVTDDTWHHVAATADGGNVKIYIDGIEVQSQPQTNEVSANNTVPFIIGENANYDWGFVGLLDEVIIFNRALTPAEVAALSGRD